MANHGLFGALAKGAVGYGTPDSRSAARTRKAQSDRQLEKLNLRSEAGIDEQEVQILKDSNQQLLNESARNKTDSAFRAFNIDGDTRHFNEALKDPTIANLYPDVLTVDRVDVQNDTKLIAQAGLDPNDFNDEAIGPKLTGRFVKFTRKDGTKELVDMTQLQAATGFTKRMNNKELEELKTRSEITKNLKSSDNNTADMKNSIREGEILDKQKQGTPLSNEETSFLSLMKDKRQGNTAGKLDEVDAQQSAMLESVGGPEGWDKLDLSDRDTRRKLAPFIQRMERMGNLNLPNDSRQVVRQVNKLMSLAEPVGKLTTEETGLMDATLFKLGKYVPGTMTAEKMTGLQAASGYNAFQNELRKVLYGSVLTPGEIEKFNSAYGTLKQQFPEVMTQFGTMLRGLRADIESVVDLNNEYIAEYRLGGSADEINTMIDNIDTVLSQEVFNPITVVDNAKKQQLKSIFGKTK